MDFNKVFEQMFSESGDNKGFNPMNYADLLGSLGSGGGSNKWLLILLLLLLCCCGCGNTGFGNFGGSGQCNNRCFDVCCRRKKHCCKKFKKYECYLDPCCCNYGGSGGYGGCGFGYSWIWVIIFIVIICSCRGKTGKDSRTCSSNVINVDTAE